MIKNKLEPYHYIINSHGGQVMAKNMKDAIAKSAMAQYPSSPTKSDKEEFYVVCGKMLVRKGRFRW